MNTKKEKDFYLKMRTRYADVVKYHLKKNCMSVSELSRQAGISQVHLYRLLSGKHIWNTEMIDKIRDVLKISLKEFFGE